MHKEGMIWRGGQTYCKKKRKINKTAGSAAVGCGMIRVDPDMLRSVRAYCVLTSFCREKERELILFGKRKMLCCAIGTRKQSVCPTVSIQQQAGPSQPQTTLSSTSFRKALLPFHYIVTFQLTYVLYLFFTLNTFTRKAFWGKEDDSWISP